MSFDWYWRRLRAMGAGEIATRVRRKVRDKYFPARYHKMTAEQAFHHFFPSDPVVPLVPDGLFELLLASPHRNPPPQAGEGVLPTDATGLLTESQVDLRSPDRMGTAELLGITLFGTRVTLDDPPNWRKNYITGQEWPDAPSHDIDYHSIDIAGGVKYVWEPSRHQVLTAMAYRYYRTSDEELKQMHVRWLEDWIAKNPVDHGIHWTSALEMAVRIIVWTWSIALIDAKSGYPKETLRRALGSMAQQAAHIEENLSFGSSANNHLIGESCALTFFGAAWPQCKMAGKWKRTGLAIATRECLRQIYPDGVPAEQAFGYLPFVWEFYLHLALAGIALPPNVVERLGTSIRFIDQVADSSGYVPQVGDEDDGSVVAYYGTGWPRYETVAHGMRAALDTPLLPGGKAAGVMEFPDGGYTVLRASDPEMVAVFDHGPLGLGSLAAHGHADALSITLSVDGQPVLVDPGVYAYHEDPAWRDYFRSTPAHNTVTINDMDQAQMLGPFLWGARSSVTKLADAWRVNLRDENKIYHDRQVSLDGHRLTVSDRIEGEYRSAKAAWHFHPSVTVEQDDTGLILSWDGRARLKMTFDPKPFTMEIIHGEPSRRYPGPGWYSPSFGRLIPTTTVQTPIEGSLSTRCVPLNN